MQTALHQQAGAAQRNGLGDLTEDNFLRMDVTFVVAQRTVEGAEAAKFRADVRVINVAIDDVGGYAIRMQLATRGVRRHADAYQVVALEEVDRLRARHHAGLPPCVDTVTGTCSLSSAVARFKYSASPSACFGPNSNLMYSCR